MIPVMDRRRDVLASLSRILAAADLGCAQPNSVKKQLYRMFVFRLSGTSLGVASLGHPRAVPIGEVQYAPGLFRHLKVAVDGHHTDNGELLLTGSQKFLLKKNVSESFPGRAEHLGCWTRSRFLRFATRCRLPN